jgi:hypothetical protein
LWQKKRRANVLGVLRKNVRVVSGVKQNPFAAIFSGRPSAQNLVFSLPLREIDLVETGTNGAGSETKWT